MPNTPPSIAAVDAAAAAADRLAETYLGPHGDAVQPIVPRHATVRNVRALGLQPGMRVLEIGTGSGYSAALMGTLVGTRGHVLTVGADEALAERAGALFAQHGHHAIAAVGDGLAGHPGRAPYDRILAAATPTTIPTAWVEQLAPDGVLVTGCLVSELPGTYAVAHITRAPGGLRAVLRAGRYAPMGPPTTHRTVATATDSATGRYVATASGQRHATLLLDALLDGHAGPWPDRQGEYLDLKNWLLATRPPGLLTAATELGEGIGLGALYAGRPEVAMITPAHFVAYPAVSPTAAQLIDLIAEWRSQGAPATHELDARVVDVPGGYQVRIDD